MLIRRGGILTLAVATASVLAVMLAPFGNSAGANDGDPPWAAAVPTKLPWPVTDILVEGADPIHLTSPAVDRDSIVEAMLSAQHGAETRPADSAESTAAPITCAYGTGWNLISTYTAQFGTIFVCSAPIYKTALDRFGYLEPVFIEFIQTDSNGMHGNIQAVWYHLKYTSIDPTDYLQWCTFGSGTVYFSTPQFWAQSYCDVY